MRVGVWLRHRTRGGEPERGTSVRRVVWDGRGHTVPRATRHPNALPAHGDRVGAYACTATAASPAPSPDARAVSEACEQEANDPGDGDGCEHDPQAA